MQYLRHFPVNHPHPLKKKKRRVKRMKKNRSYSTLRRF